MRLSVILTILLLSTPVVAGAQNASENDSSGILSSIPDIEISSAEEYNNSTGQNTRSQSNLNWIVILGLIFLGVIIYSFNIDPKWVIIFLGLAGVLYLVSYLGLIQF